MRFVTLSLLLLFATGCVPFWFYEDVKEQNRKLQKIHEEMEKKMKLLNADKVKFEKLAATAEQQMKMYKEQSDYWKGLAKEAKEELEKLRKGLTVEIEKVDWGEAKGKIYVTESGKIGVEGEVLFPAGKHTLKPKAKSTIAKLAKILMNKYKDFYFRIDGHTDNQPIRVSPYESNWHLSVMRACSVLKELAKNGVPEERMFIGGFGEFSPRVPNLDRKGHPKNRRVEITIVKSKN